MNAVMFGLQPRDINLINKCFENHPNIRAVIIYGSRAKGNFKNGSDIDLTIEGEGISYQELLAIDNELDDILLPYKIDLSVKKNISNTDLLAHIERVGKIFYDRSLHQT